MGSPTALVDPTLNDIGKLNTMSLRYSWVISHNKVELDTL